MDNTRASQKEQLRQEAARWVVVLTGAACDDEQRKAFETWRSQGPMQMLAFERALAAWERFGRLASLRPSTPSVDPDLLAPSSGMLVPDQSRSQDHSPEVRTWRRGVAQVAAVILILVCALVSWPRQTIAYETDIGEHRTIRLQDGSKIELNTNSKIRVRLKDNLRQVSLEKGEALFTVAHDATRPFVVIAGEARLRALGTVFNVRRKADAVQVTVVDGTVQIEAAAQGKGKEQIASMLTRDVSGTISDAGNTAQTLSGEQVNQLLSWRIGLLEFRSESLSAAVEEINRYNLRQLKILDPAIADIRIGGYFQTDNLDAFVEFLTTSLPVDASKNAQGDVVLRAKQKN